METNTFSPDSSSPAKDTHAPTLPPHASVVVVGAGAFGGWTALHLLRKGFSVTLIDSWGAGNARSSSGDETRVIRSTYGANELYFDLNVRALELWKEHQQQWQQTIFHNTGVLWMCHQKEAPVVDDSIPFARKNKMEYELLSPEQLREKYPILHCDDLHHAWFDPYGGYLKARESTQLVLRSFQQEGGSYLAAEVFAPSPQDLLHHQLHLSNGQKITADVMLFACGAWLASLFPDLLADKITCTKQEVYYFGTPAHQTIPFEKFPVWVDVDGKDFYYGIPGNANRGFKIGVDRRGKPFDPTHDHRMLEPSVFHHAQEFLEHRFPTLKNAPLLENRVCPYENSNDGNFIVDHHPLFQHVWFLGGGSGHGFKHGPALGEWVAESFCSGKSIPSLWRINNKS